MATGAVMGAIAVPPEPDHPEERRLFGDWEPPDAFVVARQALWDDVLVRLLEILEPRPVYFVTDTAENDWLTQRLGLAVVETAHESAWVRDYGPIQVDSNGGPLWLDAEYQSDRPGDDSLPRRLGRLLNVPVELLPERLDGGAVASDGLGLCVMTNTSVQRLSSSATRDGAAHERLGCHKIVVVPALVDEPTGHVDLLIHFLAPDTVAVGALVADLDPNGNAVRLDDAAMRLARAASELGRRLEIVRVPVYQDPRGRFFSYLNVLSLESQLLVPEFEAVPAGVQAEAHRVLSRASGKELIALPTDDIAWAGGGLHCLVLGLHLPDSSPANPERKWLAHMGVLARGVFPAPYAWRTLS